MVKPLVPSNDGGSIPAPSLQLQDLWIRPCTSIGDVRYFIERYHYSKSIKGITPFLSFEIVSRSNYEKQLGAAIFGIPGQVQTEYKYGEYKGSKNKYCGKDDHHRPGVVCVELRRFVLLDELPKNSESWILSKMLKMLSVLGIERVISYADPNQMRSDHPDGKHTGLIYRASGFRKEKEGGLTKAIFMLKNFESEGKIFNEGRRLPIRNLDQYKNFRVRDVHELKPEILLDWNNALRNKQAVRWMERATGKWVYVIKTPKYLTSLSRRLRKALEEKAAELRSENGKILYIKDLPQSEFFPCELECSLEEINGGNNSGDSTESQSSKRLAERKTAKASSK